MANWVADGAPLSAESRYEILAVHGDIGIAHWNVRQKAYYFHEPTLELDGILVLRFDAQGRALSTWSGSTAATWTTARPPP